MAERERGERDAEERRGRGGGAQGLRRERGVEQVEVQPAVRLLDQQRGDAELAEPSPDVARERLAGVGKGLHPLGRRELRQRARQAVLKLTLFEGESEVHPPTLAR